MTASPPLPIELNSNEQELFSSIKFENPSHDCFANAKQLMLSLVDRSAIPAVRLAWFDTPELNFQHGKSRRQCMELRQTKGNEIYALPNFLRHLHYFVQGPNLHNETVVAFCDMLNNHAGTEGELYNATGSFVRNEIRTRQLDKNRTAEEFFKLALEVGLNADHAKTVRQDAMQTK